MFKPTQVIDEFWVLVEKSNDCWLWRGKTNNGGYGNFHKGGVYHAHRFSWVLENGLIPKGMQINHHCDNRLCVKPDHLYAGTKKQNSSDMVSRGRVNRGSNRPLSKIKEDQVPFIRHWINIGFLEKEVANAFKISPTAVGLIKRNKTWRHVP